MVLQKFNILPNSYTALTLYEQYVSLIPRPLRDFISHLWRKVGRGLGPRLTVYINTYTYRTRTSFIIVADDKQKPVCQKCSCCPSNQLVYPYRSIEKLKVVAVDLQSDIMVCMTDCVS